MLVYGRDTVLQVVHNRGHGFQKVLPCRGAQIATHTRSTSEKPNQNPTRLSRQSNHRIQKYFRGPPLKVDPQRSRPVSETDSGFASVAVNDWEPESVTGLVDTAKTLRIQNSTGDPRTIINKAVKHGIST